MGIPTGLELNGRAPLWHRRSVVSGLAPPSQHHSRFECHSTRVHVPRGSLTPSKSMRWGLATPYGAPRASRPSGASWSGRPSPHYSSSGTRSPCSCDDTDLSRQRSVPPPVKPSSCCLNATLTRRSQGPTRLRTAKSQKLLLRRRGGSCRPSSCAYWRKMSAAQGAIDRDRAKLRTCERANGRAFRGPEITRSGAGNSLRSNVSQGSSPLAWRFSSLRRP